MTDDRRLSGAVRQLGDLALGGRQSSRGHLARWALVAAALSATVGLLPVGLSAAASSPLGKVSIITGSVAECGTGPSLGLRRPFTVTLHSRPSGRIVATSTLRPSTHVSYYAFAVGLGTYYLTTSETTSPPPRGNIVVRATSKNIITATVATVCQ